MLWLPTLLAVGCLAGGALGQGKYGGPYKGPPVVPVILPGGFIADTKEVAAAKEYHLSAVAKAADEVKGLKSYYKPSPYKPPKAYQPDTPRFQPEPKSQRYIEPQSQRYIEPQSQRYTEPKLYKAKAYPGPKASPRPAPVYEDEDPRPSATPMREYYDDGLYREQEIYYSASSPRPDPMVTPVILDNGFIADTPQVVAAKEEHFAAVAKAQEAVAQAVQRSAAQQSAAPPRVAAPPPPPPPQQSQVQQFQGYSEY